MAEKFFSPNIEKQSTVDSRENDLAAADLQSEHKEHWKGADRFFQVYTPGIVVPGNNPTEAYEVPQGGRILRINNEPVMATCEAPWAERTVLESVEEATRRLKPEYDLKILDIGYGIGITAGKYLDNIIARGSSELHIIELNHQVADDAREWAEEKMQELQKRSEKEGIASNQIKIVVHEGDIRDESQTLLSEGKQFDIICADTFPLTPEESGTHDIVNADVLKMLLYPEGVFTFFAFYPKANQTSLSADQIAILDKHFERNITGRTVKVFPPKEYEYLWVDGKPVRALPVVLCLNPKIQDKDTFAPHSN